jgi:xanthine dehydrogenase YagR molybdenum-binding subunit
MANPAAPQPKENMGEPAPRYDARLKVTGQARYPADTPLANPAYAVLVTSTIAKGSLASLEIDEARAVPGVVEVFTAEDMSDLKHVDFGARCTTSIQSLGPEIHHAGQIIAVVVADTFEAANEGAQQVKVSYNEETPSATFDTPGLTVSDATKESKTHSHVPQAGDAASAIAGAELLLDAEYGTPTQHHNPIELFATTCAWTGDRLTVYEPSQFVYGLKNSVAERLAIDPEKVRTVSHFIGGAFGSKGNMTPRTAMIALAAKRLNRPVKLVATRAQGFTIATYRAETRHHIRLGARRDGKLVGYFHEGWEVSSRPDSYVVAGVEDTAQLYAFGAVTTKVNVVHADRNTPGYMRSPPVVPYVYALESAMDEMAIKLEIDPIEFRRINDTMTSPIGGKPYSTRSLMQCYDQAAATFGWKDRSPQPRSMRDGDWLVGFGCATALYPTHVSPAAARVRLMANGDVRVQTAAHEIGNGVYTVLAQIAADRLGVDLGSVSVEVGDSRLPPAPVAGGSTTTASTCSAVLKSCDAIRSKLFHVAVTSNQGPLAGHDGAALTLKSGKIRATDGAELKLEDAFKAMGASSIEEYSEFVPHGLEPKAMADLYQGRHASTGGSHGDKVMYAMGAELVEVRVHASTCEIRVPRIVGAFAAGRLMNTRTVRSQLMGGMIWGISSALHEATEIDVKRARYVNDNLADYLVPVNADVKQVEVILVPEVDRDVNPAGVKGLGELANVGTAAAVANAVYHATGSRIRRLPIRIESLLSA